MHIKSILRQEPTNGRTKPTGNRKKLNEQFTGGQRLIFWYDADASFEAEVDRLQLGDVQILHLTENNAFRTKLLLEHEDTEGQYLIYAPFEKPAVAKNHLEDTLLYSKEFYADRLSLIAAEIGLPSRLRGSLEALKTFFAAGGGKAESPGKAGRRPPHQRFPGEGQGAGFIWGKWGEPVPHCHVCDIQSKEYGNG